MLSVGIQEDFSIWGSIFTSVVFFDLIEGNSWRMLPHLPLSGISYNFISYPKKKQNKLRNRKTGFTHLFVSFTKLLALVDCQLRVGKLCWLEWTCPSLVTCELVKPVCARLFANIKKMIEVTSDLENFMGWWNLNKLSVISKDFF